MLKVRGGEKRLSFFLFCFCFFLFFFNFLFLIFFYFIVTYINVGLRKGVENGNEENKNNNNNNNTNNNNANNIVFLSLPEFDVDMIISLLASSKYNGKSKYKFVVNDI